MILFCRHIAELGDYSFNLGLSKKDSPEQKFVGEGSSPYDAIREASIKVIIAIVSDESFDCVLSRLEIF